MTEKTETILLWSARALETLAAIAVILANATGLMSAGATRGVSIAGAILLLIAGRIRGWLPGSGNGGKAVAAAGAVILALALTLGGCTKWAGVAAGLRATVLVTRSGNAADRIIAEHVTVEHGRCKGAHGAKTPGFLACTTSARQLAKRWIVARDSISAANLLAQAALTEFYLYLKGAAAGKKIDPLKMAARSVCALARALTELQKALPALSKARAILATVEGIACALANDRRLSARGWALWIDVVVHRLEFYSEVPGTPLYGWCATCSMP